MCGSMDRFLYGPRRLVAVVAVVAVVAAVVAPPAAAVCGDFLGGMGCFYIRTQCSFAFLTRARGRRVRPKRVFLLVRLFNEVTN